ncbi:MAG: BamA/TamA family outer membrane protein [Acidobacteria bacterium]|nr:BamA/TamA family outer membrane protein [Acidobacteriota bacterium]MCA1652250.1 BamA/TamA family outer membrane protein [Acidobacteriota bacterium]
MARAAAAAAICFVVFVSPPVLSAQDTRAAELERERAQKAAALHPYKPGRLENLLLYFEQSNPLVRLSPHNGFFIDYGYTRKPVGSGIALGAGYRHDLFARKARIELEAGLSVKKYRLLRADLSMPYLADGRFELGIEAVDRYNPQEDFYGLGPLSLREDRVNFRFKGRDYLARAVVRPVDWLQVGTRIGRTTTAIGPGSDTAYPSLETRFTDASAPGLILQPNFNYGDVFAAVDYRDSTGNARSGGYYSLAVRRFDTVGIDQYDFRQIDAVVQQFFPIFDKKRVIAAQVALSAASAGSGDQVPFYLKPTLGGARTLRSVDEYRFRDDNVMFMNLEYRWEAFSALDMALFTDWGKVAARASDLDLSDLEHAYGIGFRFNTAKSVLLRFDIAAGGSEGIQYLINFSNVF